jgi:hypothetical protein
VTRVERVTVVDSEDDLLARVVERDVVGSASG